MRRGLLAAPALLAAGPAFAHGGGVEPGMDLWALLPLGLLAALYALGVAGLWRRVQGRGRLLRWAGWFAIGVLVTAGALFGPTGRLAPRSFTLHMVEHELLMLIAAPCLVLARPGAVLPWGLPRPWRRPLARAGSRVLDVLARPVPATLWQTLALWVWHAPGPFGAALAGPGWHAAQHVSFLLAAFLFWQAMLTAARTAQGSALAALCLFVTAVQSGLLGTLMTFAAAPWYAGYAAVAPPFGLTPVEDQQLAGLLMWVPGGVLHAVVALAILARWLARGATKPQGEGHAPAA